MHNFTLATLLVVICLSARANASNDPLQECFAKLVPQKVARFDYTYLQNSTYHSPKPWMVRRTEHRGSMWIDERSFTMSDTVAYMGKDYVSSERFTEDVLLFVPQGKNKPVEVTKTMFAEEVFKVAKFHPAMLLMHFAKQKEQRIKEEAEHHVYTQYINGIEVSLFINKENNLLDKVTVIRNEDVYGDVTYTINYLRYTRYNNGNNYYAREANYRRLQPGITDTLNFSFAEMVKTAPTLIEQIDNYTISEDKPKAPDVIHTEKINNHLYALHLPQAESAALLAEFKDFFVVIDVPLNSRNGELVLQEAGRIAPGKPVKYYAFCHHHPWCIGGVRPFIHTGTTVLTQNSNRDYLQFIAGNPHTIEPDSLQLNPKPLLTEEVGTTKTITDGSYKMVLYHIGEQSVHTEDYTLFYFPEEKIVFQGDMAFIKKDKPLSKAGDRQAALYHAIKKLNIEVETIVQAWPWKGEYDIKTIIPFTELEETVNMSKEKE